MAENKDTYSKKFVIGIDFKKSLAQFSKSLKNDVKAFSNNILNEIKKPLKSIADTIVNSFVNGIKEMKDMLEYSQLSSSHTRQLAFQYGFSSAQAYGWDKALSAVGLEGEEDLFYANNQELRQFREAFEKYSNYYTQLYDSGFFETMQDYQFEMANFKNEMQMQVVKFFMENKDVIKTSLQAIMDISKVVIKIFSWLVNLFNSERYATTTSDIINQWGNSSTKNSNVNINNTFNGVGKEDETWLANSGTLTYQQVIQALKN